MILYRNFGLTIKEGWLFFENDSSEKSDLIYVQQSQFPLKGFTQLFSFETIVIDLTKSKESIYLDFKKKTRYEIDRAKKSDNIIYFIDKKCCMSNFLRFYKRCQHASHLPNVNEERILKYSQKGMLFISYTQDPITNYCISAHCYLLLPNRARLIYSCCLRSADIMIINNSLTGRANRFHFWCDIIHCKLLGLTLFDFGGCFNGKNKRLLSISKFKEEFGGKHLTEYLCIKANSVKGHVYLIMKYWYLKLLNQL